jgi:hypothetical protein
MNLSLTDLIYSVIGGGAGGGQDHIAGRRLPIFSSLIEGAVGAFLESNAASRRDGIWTHSPGGALPEALT